MPQENLNKIWKAGKLFEEPKPEQPTKEPMPETKPSNVKRKINVAKAFMPQQEDPFKKKVEAVMKGIEPASAPPATAGEEEKPVPADAEVIVGTGQDDIGRELVAGKSIYVKGDVGDATGYHMSGGEIQVEGDARYRTGDHMSGGKIHVLGKTAHMTGYYMINGILRIDGDVVSFHKSAFDFDNKGTIIWEGEKIWENGTKIKPAWTNLNVQEKIAK
jgi:hypothetical protein